MALFDFMKKKEQPRRNGLTYAPTMNNAQPFYSSFGDNIYASDIVLQSIRCKANEMKKLQPRHIRTTNGKQAAITDSSIARVLKRPNAYMTTADFLEKITVLLELNKNVYIYPEYYLTKGGEKFFTGLYPLKPDKATYLLDEAGRYFIELHFASGYEVTLPANDLIHWRKDYGVGDYFGGGSKNGYGENAGLLGALEHYNQLCQSIAKAVQASCQINGVMRVNTYLDDDKTEAERARFQKKLEYNESGILFTDLKSEFVPMPHDVKLVDAETLKFFYETITRANGVSVAILNGDYNKAQKEAFYEHALEADIISLGQAFSKVLFSERESNFGNEVVFFPKAIEFMSMENKIAALQVGLPAGLFKRNEARELLGYPPLEVGGEDIPRGYNELDNAGGVNSGTEN